MFLIYDFPLSGEGIFHSLLRFPSTIMIQLAARYLLLHSTHHCCTSDWDGFVLAVTAIEKSSCLIYKFQFFSYFKCDGVEHRTDST